MSLKKKRDELVRISKENAAQRIRAHRLTRIFEIRMVNGVLKSLQIFERRYKALSIFFEKEVEQKKEGALLIWRTLTSFTNVCRLLA